MMGSHTEALQLRENEAGTFLRVLTHDDRNSYYVLATQANGIWTEAAYKARRLPFVPLNELSSCYVTHNGFTRKQRRLDETRQVNALFFDLDCHASSAFAARKAIEAALRALESACDELALPVPTMIVDSGRGVHLYYVLDRSVPYRFSRQGAPNEKGIALFRLVERRIATILDEILAPIEGIEVDRKVFDFTRVSRIPGTYNEAAGCFARLVSVNESFHDLSNLALWKPKCAGHIPIAQPSSKRRLIISYQPLMLSRLSKIVELQRLRSFRCEGNRELMCFVFYNTAVQVYAKDDALKRLSLFNKRFASPLAPFELEGIAKSVNKVVNVRGEKGYYLLSAQKVIDLLGMTPEEIESTGFFASKRAALRAEAKRATAQRRHARNEEIIALYESGKHTQESVARQVGCSERTVASVLKAAGKTRNYTHTATKRTPSVSQRRKKRRIVMPFRFAPLFNQSQPLVKDSNTVSKQELSNTSIKGRNLTSYQRSLHYQVNKTYDSAKNCPTSLKEVVSIAPSSKDLCLWRT